MEEVVGQACQVCVHATTGVACIEASKGIGDVDAQKPVTEADGSFPQSWKSTKESYEGEEGNDDDEDDGVAEGDHDAKSRLPRIPMSIAVDM